MEALAALGIGIIAGASVTLIVTNARHRAQMARANLLRRIAA